MSERERIALLSRVLGSGVATGELELGIGDDAAVLGGLGDDSLVLSVDVMVEGAHFEMGMIGETDLGYRASMGALSDLAAMGARPLGVLSALILPPSFDDDQLERLAMGQREACEQVGCAVVGGNLSRGSELSITTTVVGASAGPLRRDGARPGDRLWVAGPLGLAAIGLSLLLKPPSRSLSADEEILARAATCAWTRPVARIDEGLSLAANASAAIDVSDGLALDVNRLAEASGCRVVLDEDALLHDELVQAAKVIGGDPLALALTGGEDYALVVALGADTEPGHGMRAIGRCGTGAGVVLARRDGSIEAVDAMGWDHFAQLA
jgi:thiamine-monophosphate kinase